MELREAEWAKREALMAVEAEGPANKTTIATSYGWGSNATLGRRYRYLDDLARRGLIRTWRIGGSVMCEITEAGLTELQQWKEATSEQQG